MITFFHKEDIPAVSDIMLGLPGQTFDTCKKDLQFCFDHKVVAMLFATSVMPNAPMADEAYQRKFQIVVGDDGFVESTYSFTREDYGQDVRSGPGLQAVRQARPAQVPALLRADRARHPGDGLSGPVADPERGVARTAIPFPRASAASSSTATQRAG